MMKYGKNFPLLMKFFLKRAVSLFPVREIVDRSFRYTYREAYGRMCKLANALESLGVKEGDKIATLAWNTHQHFELYWAVPCMGAVLHPVNIRLSQNQILNILRHAEDKIVFLEKEFIPLIERLSPQLENVSAYVLMGGENEEVRFKPSYSYESLIEDFPPRYDWPEISENQPATLGYTTGTTGEPKGVCFTQRMLFLHTLITLTPEGFAINRYDTILHIVPMFHVHSWGLPYDATVVGAKQVFPGRFKIEALFELIEREKVTVTAAVPTVYIMMLEHPKADEYDLSSLRIAFSGGAPTSPGLIKSFREKFGVQLVTSYGLTETCPVLTKAHLKPHMKKWPIERMDEVYAKTGLFLPGLDLKIVDEKGKEVPRDGKTVGEIIVRGPYVALEYFKDSEKTSEAWDENGYFHTADAAVMDEEGYITIVDRYKDIIRSGGEMIPSLVIDKIIEKHPAVASCATIAMPHKKWGERPLACVVLKPEYKGRVSEEEIISFCKGKMPKWQLPDAVVFMDEIPLTSTGKKDKRKLRTMKPWEKMKTK